MLGGPSTLSLMASGLYLLVSVLAALAAQTAASRSQQTGHLRGWVCIAVFFALLAAARWLDLENVIRDELRSWLTSDARYEQRREFQRIIVAAIVALGGAFAFVYFYRSVTSVRGRRDAVLLVAWAACAVMAGLITLRLISLHAIDALLYGPLKLNWIGDLGLSLAVAVAALFYLRIVRARP